MLTVTGCATVHRHASYSSFGEANPSRDALLAKTFKDVQGKRMPPEAANVTVLIDTLPKGVTMTVGGIKVEDGFEHEIIGKFGIGSSAASGSGYFFANYRETWRKPVCYPQTVLWFATLAIWGMVPTYWPCYTTDYISKEEFIEQLRLVGYLAGGNLVIANFLQADQESAASAFGFILRQDPRTRPSAPTPKPKEASADSI